MCLRSAMSIYKGISKNPPELSLFVSLQSLNKLTNATQVQLLEGGYYIIPYPLVGKSAEKSIKRAKKHSRQS